MKEKTTVLKISFKPDHAVEAFMPPSAIATKGNKLRPTRRGGVKQRFRADEDSPAELAEDQVSIPETVLDEEPRLPLQISAFVSEQKA